MSSYTAKEANSNHKLLIVYPHMAMAPMLLSAKPGNAGNLASKMLRQN